MCPVHVVSVLYLPLWPHLEATTASRITLNLDVYTVLTLEIRLQ